MLKRSPLAPPYFPALPKVDGVRVAGLSAGLKKGKKRDLFVADLKVGTTIAGKFTTSQCPSAPVDWCRQAIDRGRARAIIVNSGNANAFTGKAGDRTVAETVKAAVRHFNCRKAEVFLASTGVIGEPLAPEAIGKKLPRAIKALKANSWSDAADSIRTTDTFSKGACRETEIDGTPVRIVGIAKGSGMIAPDMATMLSFIFTNAKIPSPVLQKLLDYGTSRSFNSITVDSDTSTSDTVLLAATGVACHKPVSGSSQAHLRHFRQALTDLMIDLATQVVRDGEGATKFITIDVTGAASVRAAKCIGFAIANSPLVKTAIAGEDANWGRIVMAVGKAGEKADRDKLSISMGGVPITKNGWLVDGYDEAPVQKHLKGQEVTIEVDVGVGTGKARVWTCDLTHGYISINADYRS
ncbi:bifunctional glutamate N-acetyltransferase/amino-acid acetyltransferase ArgJ [Alphaproteobacteria bacterium]|nr:bifunctional glutamate N-acetyltransferase/amino-acid acetyltransferase ArgJ [Alphaproteobacteria bacterium]